MAYSQPVYTGHDHDYGYPIYLLTTPLQNQRKFLSKPIDVFSHWAICIQGYCYKLTKNPDAKNSKKNPKHIMRQLPEQEWSEFKRTEKRVVQQADDPVGYTAKSWPPETIKEIGKHRLYCPDSLRGKYAYDENNCQVFIRLLVDLIGNDNTKASFPSFFDKWVKGAGITRNSTALAATAGMVTVAASVSLSAALVDGGATAAAGIGSTTALFTDRHSKEEFIQKAQKDLREKLRRKDIFGY